MTEAEGDAEEIAKAISQARVNRSFARVEREKQELEAKHYRPVAGVTHQYNPMDGLKGGDDG